MFQEGEPDTYGMYLDDGEGFTYTYDACSRLTAVIGPDGVRQASYTYDPAGNLTEEADAEGRCTYRSYTAFGELKEKLTPALEEDGVMLYERTTWQYDRCGNVLLEQRHGGYWDKNGVLVKEDGAGLALRFTYDSRNRRIRVEDGLGAVISYRYDVQGKLVYEEKAVSGEVRQVIHYGYDRAGRLTERKEELDSGLVHTVEATAANVHDATETSKLLTGDEDEVYGDSGYLGAEKRGDAIIRNKAGRKIKYRINRRPSQVKKLSKSGQYAAKKAEHAKSSVRAKVEHAFGVVKKQLHFRKTRYRGLEKQRAKFNIMFALANLILADRPCLAA